MEVLPAETHLPKGVDCVQHLSSWAAVPVAGLRGRQRDAFLLRGQRNGQHPVGAAHEAELILVV